MRIAEYVDGIVIYRDATPEEIKAREDDKPTPTDTDRIEAQVMYTALMTDTLLESEV